MIADTIVFKLQADVTDLQAKFAQANASVGTLGTSAVRGAGNVDVLKRGLSALAIQATGISPAIGHLAIGLSQFAEGSVLAVGLVAGVGAIVGAYKLANKELADFDKAVDKAVEAGHKLLNSAHDAAVAQRAAIQGQLVDLRASLDIAQHPATIRTGRGAALIPGIVDEVTVEHLNTQIASLMNNLQLAQSAVDATTAQLGKGMDKGTEATARLIQKLKEAYNETLDLFRMWRERGAFLAPLANLPPPARGTITTGPLRGTLPGLQPTHTYQEMSDESNRIREGITDPLEQQLKEAGAQIGASFITAMASGMKSMSGFLKQVVLELANIWLVGVFKKALGILSPSLVGLELGTNFSLGLAQGVNAGRSMVGTASSNMATRLAGSAAINLNVSGMPPAGNPLAAARDGTWQRFLRESNLVARGDGFKFS